jgi:hypothetical protein
MADEARRHGFYLAGHVPEAVSVSEAADGSMNRV